MKLPTCWNCNYQFWWHELMFIFGWKKKCPDCGEMQYVTIDSIRKTYFLFLPLMFFIFIALNLPDNFLGQLLLLVVGIPAVLSPQPFLLKFTDHQQPLF
ncbi:TIGR04104 family putative zinc finger protein [Piscibacillus sp. B03]|uniref:TIGR04104 family putative zinc finger protein n=1 Tax=Piscibacillus sp. B03 TaxID=3457430 RepID=UPI003FCE21DF